MLCCLNPSCYNPSAPDGTKFCPNCGVSLFVLRNRYSPIKPLGGGGFGKTYLAQDIDKLSQKCVIKQFAPQVQGTEALRKAKELFEQEARRLELLGEHPQIPRLLAYFQEDTHLYLVQQFIDGQNLFQQLQQQGTFSEGNIRDLLLDLLNILKVVHKHKVIHRDIKPENIIQCSDRKVFLIDFGASKQLTKTVITGQGTTIGSFGYASLEQMEGGEAYPASDLYSLGATCFHLLSGMHPWELWKRQGYGWVGSWREHLQQPVSQQLGQILDQLLQQDYQQRYQSSEEVLQALNPPPSPPKPPPVPQPNQRLQRHTPVHKKFSTYLFVIPLIVFIGAGIVYLPQLTENAETYEDYSKAIKMNPDDADAENNQGNAPDDLGDKQEAIEDNNKAIKMNPDDAKTYYNRGNARYQSRNYKGAIKDYDQAIKINPNYAKAYIGRGLARSDWGYARYKSGEEQAAIENYNQAIKDYNQAIKINPKYAKTYNNRCNTRNKLGDYQAAIQDCNQAIKINPNYAHPYYNRGLAHSNLGDKQAAQAAIEDFRKAADLYKQQGNEIFYQYALNRIKKLDKARKS